MNIYVGNLPYSVRDQELRETFEAYGTVTAAEVIFDKRTRRSRGYGFVEMASEVEAQRAIAALNGKELHGRELRVDASQPKTDKPPRAEGEERERAPRRPAPQQTGSREPAAPPPADAPAGIKGFFKRLFG
jgi:cold-inducible RNA-binding protein